MEEEYEYLIKYNTDRCRIERFGIDNGDPLFHQEFFWAQNNDKNKTGGNAYFYNDFYWGVVKARTACEALEKFVFPIVKEGK